MTEHKDWSYQRVKEPFELKSTRRNFMGGLMVSMAGLSVGTSVGCESLTKKDGLETFSLKFKEFFKKNYRLMTDKEKAATIKRLERLSEIKDKTEINIDKGEPLEGVSFGYAFNISKCRGYMDCVKACVKENNLDESTGMQYIRIIELKKGDFSLRHANHHIEGEVPKEDHFYLGMQCFHCEDPPCVPVCPTGATWKERDGIVVVDYDWCIGCRYCIAACPYEARRFNWQDSKVDWSRANKKQHYLGNRKRPKGVVEKCTFCVQRTRKGLQPACAEACPTGARIFGNLLDPKSEIRQVLATKKVFRLKEELGAKPQFWYFMD